MTMTFDDPRWTEFDDRLSGPEGCHFRDEGGVVEWNCKHGRDKTLSEAILRNMGLNSAEIKSTFAYFEARGGFCDCEIAMHAWPTDVDEQLIRQEETTDRALEQRAARESHDASAD
jgi:hypothetical protein